MAKAKSGDLTPSVPKKRGRPRKYDNEQMRKQAQKERKRAYDHENRSKGKISHWWEFILYPESAPSDWRDRLDKMHLEYVVSPLHDHDENADGTRKKPHYHIIIHFDESNSRNGWMFKDVKRIITEPLNQPEPEYIISLPAAARYLTHRDNPEKYQYKTEDIEEHNGLTLRRMEKYSTEYDDVVTKEIMRYIKANNIRDYGTLMYSLEAYDDELFRFARRKTIYFTALTKALFFANKK